MALFESYERRIKQINETLNSYGIASIEEAEKIMTRPKHVSAKTTATNTSLGFMIEAGTPMILRSMFEADDSSRPAREPRAEATLELAREDTSCSPWRCDRRRGT